eukprot:11617994-Alexandrium_andersonii.AAC.1
MPATVLRPRARPTAVAGLASAQCGGADFLDDDGLAVNPVEIATSPKASGPRPPAVRPPAL